MILIGRNKGAILQWKLMETFFLSYSERAIGNFKSEATSDETPFLVS